MAQQTAVEWLIDQVEDFIGLIPLDIIEQVKQMEKEQMDKVSEDWWNEAIWHMNGGETRYESFEQYYNETYGTE